MIGDRNVVGSLFGRIIRQWAACSVLCLSLFSATMASSSSSGGGFHSNYNAYNYDMTTPTFTPDGRLLQVEYASAAAESSSPLVAFQVNETLVILMGLKQKQTTTTNEDFKTQSPYMLQNRMVLLQDNTICVAMSGILADSIALLQVVLKEASRRLRQFQTSLTVLQVATTIANACQEHAFGGGIRPYGSTMLVCGVQNVSPHYNNNNNNNNNNSDNEAPLPPPPPIMYQTDPSGAILPAPAMATSSSSKNDVRVRWIVGGSLSLQRQLQRRLEHTLTRLAQRRSSLALVDLLAIMANTLKKEIIPQKTSVLKTSTPSSSSSPISLEVVLISSTMGCCHRLSHEQVQAIIEKM